MKTVLGAIGFDPGAPIIQEIESTFKGINVIFPTNDELSKKARADILLINEVAFEDVDIEVWNAWQREFFILLLRGSGKYFLKNDRWEIEREYEIIPELDELIREAKSQFSEIPISLLRTWKRSPVDLFAFHGKSYYRKLQGDIFYSDEFFQEINQRSRSKLFVNHAEIKCLTNFWEYQNRKNIAEDNPQKNLLHLRNWIRFIRESNLLSNFPISAANLLSRVAEELIFLFHEHKEFCEDQIELISQENDEWPESHVFLAAFIYLHAFFQEKNDHQEVITFYLGQHLLFQAKHLAWIKSKNEFKELRLNAEEKQLVMNHGNLLANCFEGTILKTNGLKELFQRHHGSRTGFGFTSFSRRGLEEIQIIVFVINVISDEFISRLPGETLIEVIGRTEGQFSDKLFRRVYRAIGETFKDKNSPIQFNLG